MATNPSTTTRKALIKALDLVGISPEMWTDCPHRQKKALFEKHMNEAQEKIQEALKREERKEAHDQDPDKIAEYKSQLALLAKVKDDPKLSEIDINPPKEKKESEAKDWAGIMYDLLAPAPETLGDRIFRGVDDICAKLDKLASKPSPSPTPAPTPNNTSATPKKPIPDDDAGVELTTFNKK